MCNDKNNLRVKLKLNLSASHCIMSGTIPSYLSKQYFWEVMLLHTGVRCPYLRFISSVIWSVHLLILFLDAESFLWAISSLNPYVPHDPYYGPSHLQSIWNQSFHSIHLYFCLLTCHYQPTSHTFPCHSAIVIIWCLNSYRPLFPSVVGWSVRWWS